MLINLVAHTCVPQGLGSGGELFCFCCFIYFGCAVPSNKRWQLRVRCSARRSSLVSNIIYHQFPFFKFHCECTNTHTHQHTMGGRKTTANSGWTVQKPYSAVRGFSVLLPPCREQINCVVSCRRLCCLWMMTMGCRSCRSHASQSRPDHTIAHLFPSYNFNPISLHCFHLAPSFSPCRLWPCLIRCAAQTSKYSRTRTWLARWCSAWPWEASCCWWVQQSNYIMFSLPTTDYSSTTFMRSFSPSLCVLSAEWKSDLLLHLWHRRHGLHILLLSALADGHPLASDLWCGGLRPRLLSAAHGCALRHQHFNHHSVSNCWHNSLAFASPSPPLPSPSSSPLSSSWAPSTPAPICIYVFNWKVANALCGAVITNFP